MEEIAKTLGSTMFMARLFGPIVVGSVSLACTVPSWKALQRLPELLAFPYDPHLLTGEAMGLGLGVISVVYGVLGPLAALGMLIYDSKLVLFGIFGILVIIDLAVASSLMVQLTYMSHYLPRPLGSCENAKEWAFEKIKPSIYSVIAAQAKTTPEKACLRFNVARRSNIFLAVVFSMISIPMFIYGLFKILGELLHLSRNLAPPIRFTIALIRKLRRRRHRVSRPADLRKSLLDIPLKDLSRHQASRARSAGETVLTLQVKDTQIWLLVDYIHYSDLMSLTLISKSVRHAVRSSAGFSLSAMRRRTCITGTKSSCWGCGGQICKACKTTRAIPDPLTTCHITQCDTVCASCYFFYACRSSTTFPVTNGLSCTHRQRTNGGPAKRDLCSACSAGDDEVASAKRQEKEFEELKHLESTAKVFCSLCHGKMWRWVPRWWICSVCGLECRSSLHTHWIAGSNG